MTLHRLYCLLLTCSLLVLIVRCTSERTKKSNALVQEVSQSIPENVDFIFHVKPILSDRCFKCHGPDENKIEGGLQLHTEKKAFAALGEQKDRYAIVRGDVSKSELVHRINTDDPEKQMPPPESNLSLTEYEKQIIAQWIDQGAEWKKHWSFLPIGPTETPSTKNVSWLSNPIDNFILKKIEEQQLKPSPNLAPEKLIRKLSFDLRGLPPSIEEIESYQNNPTPDNYNIIIDQYLSSDAHAEHMTSDWLDLARYADTHGYQDDLERIMWPWRDWVIHAFKNNMPYDQFVKWQLAGDLLPNPTKEQIIATAFNRNHKITQEGGVIPEEYRAEYVTDRTNTFGTAFLGLTFECAKCHDHKYDPISQKEYFQLFSYFNNITEKGLIEAYGAIPEPYIELTQKEIEETLTFINNLDTLETIPLLIMEERKQARTTHILNRGVYDQLGDIVESDVPSFGNRRQDQIFKNRLDLAEWLFTKENPLTARVQVNRLWQKIFGQGLVSTTYDFGSQGALPSHPELLDHLALKFMNEGWDNRSIIKYIVNSSTYKQDSQVNESLLKKDPENKYLARSTRSRLSAEMIRDHALSISGLLVNEVGGPSVKPYQPEGLWSEVTGGGGGSTAKYVQDKGSKNYRRSLYTFWKRTVPPPNMMLFDTPTRDFCSVQREHTSTPQQALVLLNDPQFLEMAQGMVINVYDKSNKNSDNIISKMFMLATSRVPSATEMQQLEKLYIAQLVNYDNGDEAADDFLSYGEFVLPEGMTKSELAAFTFIASTILNLDETIRKT